VLKQAVKIVNRAWGFNIDDFRILRRVNLACQAGEDTWYGGSDIAERFSLFETFAHVANTDVDGARSLARNLDGPPTRIRSLISITKAMTKKARGSPAASPVAKAHADFNSRSLKFVSLRSVLKRVLSGAKAICSPEM
jgi:hypothetical protein